MDYRRDFETAEEYQQRIARESLRDDQPGDGGVVPKQPERKVIARPGNYYARLAWENGDDDEYSNTMKARYGGEW